MAFSKSDRTLLLHKAGKKIDENGVKAEPQHPQRKTTRRKTKRAAWQGSVPCSANSFFFSLQVYN